MARIRITVRGVNFDTPDLNEDLAEQILFDVWAATAPKFDYATDPPTPITYTNAQKVQWVLREIRSFLSETAKRHRARTLDEQHETNKRTQLEGVTL